MGLRKSDFPINFPRLLATGILMRLDNCLINYSFLSPRCVVFEVVGWSALRNAAVDNRQAPIFSSAISERENADFALAYSAITLNVNERERFKTLTSGVVQTIIKNLIRKFFLLPFATSNERQNDHRKIYSIFLLHSHMTQLPEALFRETRTDAVKKLIQMSIIAFIGRQAYENHKQIGRKSIALDDKLSFDENVLMGETISRKTDVLVEDVISIATVAW